MSATKVVRERFTYERHVGSFFADVIAADQGNADAAQRLWRHGTEMSELRRDSATSHSERALSSTDAAGGYLVPPLYLQEEFVNLARAGRVTANVIGSRPLPPNTDSVNVPRMTSGTTVATQADLGNVSSTDAVFDLISADVLTLAGQQDVSRQVVDRSLPGVDEVIFSDLARAYHYNLDLGRGLEAGRGGDQIQRWAAPVVAVARRDQLTPSEGIAVLAALLDQRSDQLWLRGA